MKLLTMALVSLILFSCSNDEESDLLSKDGTTTYSAVSISFPKTMSLKATDPTAANDVETKVTSLGVYIIDDFNGFMHKALFTTGQFTENGDNYLLNSAVKTTTGDKSIYVVLNPSTTLQDEIDNHRGGIFGDRAISGTAETSFVTAQDVVMASVASTPTTLTLKNETEALATPLVISVQRNVAKIAVKKKSTNITVTGGSVSNLEFALIVEAKQSYLIQQGGNTLATVKTPAQNIQTLTPENDYFTKLATPTLWKGVNESSVINKNLQGFYALENANVLNLTGNTTAAIIKAQYTPAANSVVIAYAPNGTRTMGSIAPGTSFYVKKSDNSFWSESAYGTAIASGFTAEHFSKIYENGTSYYRIWVQDETNKRGVLRNNYYVLSINKISGPGLPYVPGVDPDDNTNPEDPNQPIEEDTFISVDVTVLPWNVQNSDHEI